MLSTGCRASAPPRTGFLQDYSKLEQIDRSTYRYFSDELAGYELLVLDPVAVRIDDADSRLSEEQLEAAGRYFDQRLAAALSDAGFTALGQSYIGYPEGSVRVRLAITDIDSPTILLNLHPGSKLTGAGTGGAAMEGEIVDSKTGAQLAAFVQAGRGSQFEFDQFKRLDDVKDVIDQWVDDITAGLVAARQAYEGFEE